MWGSQIVRRAGVALWLAACAGGWAAIVSRPEPRLVGPQAPGHDGELVPTEKDKTTLPPYVIEPPDILLVDVTRVVPKPPYRLQANDVITIQIEGGLPIEAPPNNQYIVNPSGRVDLGPQYGKIKVTGLTEEEAAQAIQKQLKDLLKNPLVSVQLVASAGLQQITGEHLVGPDGTVNLGTYGSVYVAGMTVDEARAAIESQLGNYLDNPQAAVSLFSYNSKVYYVVTEGAGLGDTVTRFPITGNETVLDALAQSGGISRVSSKRLWIARPMPGGSGCDTILPVDWQEITKGGATATNYQILPGDRVFIAQDNLIALDSALNRVIAPIERLFGVTLLSTQTVQTINRFPLGISGIGGGF
jgi:protein involved in polysaccharide export with SLBB domain